MKLRPKLVIPRWYLEKHRALRGRQHTPDPNLLLPYRLTASLCDNLVLYAVNSGCCQLQPALYAPGSLIVHTSYWMALKNPGHNKVFCLMNTNKY